MGAGWCLVGGRVFSSLLGAGEVPGGGGFCFQVRNASHVVLCACGGISETKASCGLVAGWS